jgi:Tfp pilus assembly protein PilZ
LAMLSFDLKDMRKIYSSDLDWLKNQSLIWKKQNLYIEVLVLRSTLILVKRGGVK